MTSPKKATVLDPDYEITEVAREHIRLKECAENRETLEKIIDIINREFKTELDHRQSQLDLIQQRLNKAQKTLHLLRYILINTYYNDQDLFVQQSEELSNINEDLPIFNKNRLHPAVRKLMIASNSNDYKLNFATSPRKKMKYLDNETCTVTQKLSSEVKCEPNDKISVIQINKSEIANVMLSNSPQKEEYDTGRNRRKAKYRIVVGNISKWMPSESEEDKSTHKWMVYVRGSKDNPDISHFVEKVVFYLHPSYEPNDVVELRCAPFHLSRRGWGEFPLRVKIFFQYALNKPVNIIHNLKLDKTFSGQQTLGNETIVNLFLYRNDKIVIEKGANSEEEYSSNCIIKEEIQETNDEYESKSKLNFHATDLENEIMTYSEHDYCTANVKKEIIESNTSSYDFYIEHSYARTEVPPDDTCNILVKSEEQSRNDLMYGINDDGLQKLDTIEEPILDDINTKLKSRETTQKFLTNSSAVVIKYKRPQESLLKKVLYQNTKETGKQVILVHKTPATNDIQQPINTTRFTYIDYKKYKVDVPKDRFKSSLQLLPYLLRRMPLVTETAKYLDYKCTYPYAAKSLQEYCNWNIGRRLSSEWFQAKMILQIIHDVKLSGHEKITPKFIIMYARSHGFTPLANYEIFKNKTLDIATETNLDTEARPNIPLSLDSEEVVDVINCTSDESKSNHSTHKIKLIDQRVDSACSFVKQVALDGGIILKPQEIIPGVIFNGTERMLLKATLCLAENIIRGARANLVYKENFDESTSIIECEDIYKAICQRPQFKFLYKLDLNK